MKFWIFLGLALLILLPDGGAGHLLRRHQTMHHDKDLEVCDIEALRNLTINDPDQTIEDTLKSEEIKPHLQEKVTTFIETFKVRKPVEDPESSLSRLDVLAKFLRLKAANSVSVSLALVKDGKGKRILMIAANTNVGCKSSFTQVVEGINARNQKMPGFQDYFYERGKLAVEKYEAYVQWLNEWIPVDKNIVDVSKTEHNGVHGELQLINILENGGYTNGFSDDPSATEIYIATDKLACRKCTSVYNMFEGKYSFAGTSDDARDTWLFPPYLEKYQEKNCENWKKYTSDMCFEKYCKLTAKIERDPAGVYTTLLQKWK